MGMTIRARVNGGKLEPLEKVDLPEGREVLISVVEVPKKLDLDAFHRSAGAWKGLVDAESLIRKIYANRLRAER